jgi:hypothetical protein
VLAASFRVLKLSNDAAYIWSIQKQSLQLLPLMDIIQLELLAYTLNNDDSFVLTPVIQSMVVFERRH